jgi:transposase
MPRPTSREWNFSYEEAYLLSEIRHLMSSLNRSTKGTDKWNDNLTKLAKLRQDLANLRERHSNGLDF